GRLLAADAPSRSGHRISATCSRCSRRSGVSARSLTRLLARRRRQALSGTTSSAAATSKLPSNRIRTATLPMSRRGERTGAAQRRQAGPCWVRPTVLVPQAVLDWQDGALGEGMNVTITGATGLIGSRLVRALRARGDGVT